jgi:N-acetylmuramic acid 6-phosphate etherase
VRMVSELTGQPPAAAHRLLAEAGGSVRLALAIHLTGAPAAEARERLKTAGLRQLEEACPRKAPGPTAPQGPRKKQKTSSQRGAHGARKRASRAAKAHTTR